MTTEGEPTKAQEIAAANERVHVALERARVASWRATTWATVSIGLSSFALGFAIRGLLGS